MPSKKQTQQVQNLNVARLVSLPSPRQLDGELPSSEASRRTVLAGRRTIERILSRDDKRMLVIVGPCSIHDEKAAKEYADRLAELRRRVGDRLEIVMRVYFEKPRTTVGWKGLINDPHLDGSFDMAEGLRIARRLMMYVTELGLPTATELLDPITPQYIDDLLCWAAIGARTTESQTHRQMASGLSMPVGFKNSTEGNLQVAVDAMGSARASHAFVGVDDDGRTVIVFTRGNPWGHVILRGGGGKSNYAEKDVAAAAELLAKAGLCTSLMVDCSHANSGKKYAKQQIAWKSVIEQRVAGNVNLTGLMLESNLFEGSQPTPAPGSAAGTPLDSLKYGVSITDACIGWEETEELMMWAHERLG